MSNLDTRIAQLAAEYRSLGAEILAEAIRIPADYVDKSPEQGGDPLCGLSNHEGPRLEYLKAKLIEPGQASAALKHQAAKQFDNALDSAVKSLKLPAEASDYPSFLSAYKAAKATISEAAVKAQANGVMAGAKTFAAFDKLKRATSRSNSSILFMRCSIRRLSPTTLALDG